MDVSRFYTILDDHGILFSQDQYDLKELIDKYPYFQPAMFRYLKSLYSTDYSSFNNELERLSIFVRDRRALFYYILSEEYGKFFQQSGKTNIHEDKTSILLNAFFESKDDVSNDLDLEFTISNSSMATTDYFSYIESGHENDVTDETLAQPATVEMRHQSIIDSFIEKSEIEGGIRIKIDNSQSQDIPTTISEETEKDELTDDLFFTETLAKIYIKQKKYEKAYKIIEHLSLNYPKKNAYFADQLNFLEKLIINTKFKNIK